MGGHTPAVRHCRPRLLPGVLRSALWTPKQQTSSSPSMCPASHGLSLVPPTSMQILLSVHIPLPCVPHSLCTPASLQPSYPLDLGSLCLCPHLLPRVPLFPPSAQAPPVASRSHCCLFQPQRLPASRLGWVGTALHGAGGCAGSKQGSGTVLARVSAATATLEP